MNKFYLTIAVLSLLGLTGCGNLSPRDNFSPKIDEKIGKIEGNQNELENNLNSIKTELMNIKNSLKIDGQNNQVQQGWLNIRSDGYVIGAFGAITIGMLLFYMYKSNKYQKTATILSEQIKLHNDETLNERILASAWNTNVEKTVYSLLH